MNRLEPNLLLAASTTLALALLVMTSMVYGEVAQGGAGWELKYPIIAVACIVFYVVGNGWWARRTNRATPPMINPETPTTAIWALALPTLVILFAGVPLIWSGHDYGLLVIIAAVMAGVATDSALRARRR